MNNKALEFAIKSLISKQQSEQEMRERLRKRFPQADANPIIERLKELNYLNDQAFCEAWIRHRALTSARGKRALLFELKKKGIAPQFIEESLAAFEETEALQELAEKKWPQIKGETFWKKREKLMRFLLSRGFAMDNVITIVNSVAQKD